MITSATPTGRRMQVQTATQQDAPALLEILMLSASKLMTFPALTVALVERTLPEYDNQPSRAR